MNDFSQIRIARWLNKVFPPAASGVFSPGDFEKAVRLVQNALPTSLQASRMRINQQFTVNPATVLNTVTVPAGRLWYVHAADWVLFSGVPTSTNLALIQVADPTGTDQAVTVAAGTFGTTTDGAKVFTHAGSNPQVIGAVTSGGGTGGFVVPAGHVLRANTAQTPGTAVYRLNWLFVELLEGEECPDYS